MIYCGEKEQICQRTLLNQYSNSGLKMFDVKGSLLSLKTTWTAPLFSNDYPCIVILKLYVNMIKSLENNTTYN